MQRAQFLWTRLAANRQAQSKKHHWIFRPWVGLCWLWLLIGWEVNLKCFHCLTLVLRASLGIKNRHCKWEDANAMQKRWSQTEPAGWVPSLQRTQAALSWYKHHRSSAQHPLAFMEELEQLFINCKACSASLHIFKIHLLHQWTDLGVPEYFWRTIQTVHINCCCPEPPSGEQQANGQKWNLVWVHTGFTSLPIFMLHGKQRYLYVLV